MKRKYKRRLLVSILIFGALSKITAPAAAYGQDGKNGVYEDYSGTAETGQDFSGDTDYTTSKDPSEELNALSPSAVLMDAATGIVIYGKNMNQKSYPASTTKVMTALLLLEKSGDNLNDRVYFSYNAVHNIEPGSSHIAMDEGETLSVEECVYAMLLPSANEVCNAVAEYVSGSVESFCQLMNQRAAELGALNTHFTNPNGLYSDDHYTTVYDMSLIMREALRYDLFVKAISTYRYEIPFTEKQAEPRIMHNSNKLIQQGSQYFNPDVVGSKTGYTVAAKHSLCTYGFRDGVGLITCQMGADKEQPYLDTKNLLDYGFEHFKEIEVFNPGDFSYSLPVAKGAEDSQEELFLPLRAEQSIIMNLPDNVDWQALGLEQTLDVPSSVALPITEGDKIGVLTICYRGEIWGTTDLLAGMTLHLSETLPAFSSQDANATEEEEGEESPIKGSLYLATGGLIIMSLLALYKLRVRKTQQRNKIFLRRGKRYSKAYRGYRYRN